MTICNYCSRDIELDGGLWVDPEASGDDITWREICDANDTFAAPHEPGETQPQHLSAEYWAECLELRDYLVHTLDGLALCIGLVEPENNNDGIIKFLLAPSGNDTGAALWNREARKWLITDKELTNLSDILVEIPTLERPSKQVAALLIGAVMLLENIE